MTEKEIIEQYKIIHNKYKYGSSGIRLLGTIQYHVNKLKPKSILDYGCGNSKLLDELETDAIKYKYDPAIKEYSKLEVDKVDLLICTDVLEHMSKDIIDNVLVKIRRLSNNALICISTIKADKILPNGMNAHLIVMSIVKWMILLGKYYHKIKLVKYRNERNQFLFRTF